MDNMECSMDNEDKGFDEYIPPQEEIEESKLDDASPNLTPPVKETPGFVFSTTLISLLGAVVYITKIEIKKDSISSDCSTLIWGTLLKL